MPKRRTLVYPHGAVPDEHRCRKSDGKRWRCPMRAMERVGFCDHHYQQIRRNFDRRKALAASAASFPPATPSPPSKRRRMRADPQPDETAAMKEEVEKRKRVEVDGEEKKRKRDEEDGEGEETRDLPNGVMTISPAEARARGGNAGSLVDWKLGFEEGLLWRRSFRSKNAEPVPIGPVKRIPGRKGLVRKRKRVCHRCGERELAQMVRCSSCRKGFFCLSCIKKWYSPLSEAEVKIACPVCRGDCNCKTCLSIGAKDGGSKELENNRSKLKKIKQASYLISHLLPVQKQINHHQLNELEIEAIDQGRRFSCIQIPVAEHTNDNELIYCNYCEASLAGFHRSCSGCSYRLCLICCAKFRRGSLSEMAGTEQCCNAMRACKTLVKEPNGIKQAFPARAHSDNSSVSSDLLFETKDKKSESCISCPPKESGGCGDGLLKLMFMMPFGCSKEPSEEKVA